MKSRKSNACLPLALALAGFGHAALATSVVPVKTTPIIETGWSGIGDAIADPGKKKTDY